MAEHEEPLTPETLQKKLQEYNKALEQEWALANDSNASEEAAEEITREFFKKHVPIAAANIVHLAQFSTSDSVRASCSKYIIEQGVKADQESGDPIQKLIDKLKKNDKPAVIPNS